MKSLNQGTDTTHDYTGAIEQFNIGPWLDAANILTAYDDPLRALKLLELLPGYYRDHKPKEVIELTNAIHRKIATPTFYAKNIETSIIQMEEAKQCINYIPRFNLLFNDLRNTCFNHGINPHILEVAPGPYVIPQALLGYNHNFTYDAVSLNPFLESKVKEVLTDKWRESAPEGSKKFFVAFEFIEHLHYEKDIAAEYHRKGYDADVIHISTPKYTYNGSIKELNWRDKDLGHLRTYTPREFYDVVSECFKDLNGLFIRVL